MAKETIAVVFDIDVPEDESSPVLLHFSFDDELLKVIESGCAENGIASKGKGRIYNGEMVYELEKT